jgi:DNA-binding transcriptional LysR family regulator
MDFEQLKTFLEVWHQKSFSRAAEKLRITQPAVSAQIQSLEREVGERLFDRKGGKVTFTAAGRVFEPFAEHALDCQRHLMLMVSEQRRSPRGEISISAQESTSLYVLPDVFAEFKVHYPKVALKIARAERSRTVEAILGREVDFGVVSLPVTDQRFMVETIHVDELVLAIPKGHPLGKAQDASPRDIAKHSFLLPKQGRQRDLLLNVFRMHDVHPKAVMEVESSELMKRFIRAGLGIGFLPSINIEAERKAGTIEVVKVEELRLSRDLGLIYLKEKTLTHAAKAFLQIAIGGVRLDLSEPSEAPARKKTSRSEGSLS